MTNTSLCRVGLLALLVVVSSSCHDTTPPTTVSPTQPTPVAPPPPPPPPPPPVPRGGPFPGAGTYAFVSSPSGRPVHPYTADSHYVLYDDGTFALRSPSSSFEVKGRYKYENEHVTFDFDWNSQNEGAVGVFDGNRMTVTYNSYMGMSDFVDAVYQLK